MSRYPEITPCSCAGCVARRAANTANMKAMHDDRRAAKVCINHPSRKAYKGGRCRACWEAKLAGERDRYVPRSKR